MDFVGFSKIPRLFRDIVITEKIDGTTAQVHVLDDGTILAGSRSRYVTPEADNHGFAKWVRENTLELAKLGPGRHFGEWWGQGINRGYGLKEKRFSLFNVAKWGDTAVRPACCHVVPVIVTGIFNSSLVQVSMDFLKENGSMAVSGYMNPEGIVVFHKAGKFLFKATLEKDDEHKGVGGS